ncbi:MAG: methyltransferase domain-containing protein [Verrucomicrobiae bacterium]|nr:methyltransferase domain-containing protein [Verrucomicrobiae bacterium]
MSRLGRLLWGKITPRRVLLRLVEATNARLGRRAQGRLYFEDLYRERDPWNYEESAYEQVKYAKTLELLPQPRFQRALEVGCSIGVFTHQLAAKADEVIALDISARACRRARMRCADQPQVHIRRGDLVHFVDAAGFDLILCAEMLYYLWDRPRERAIVGSRLGALLRPGGWLALVFGGSGVGQDWEGELERRAGLVRHETRFFDDPVRSWRFSLLRKPG